MRDSEVVASIVAGDPDGLAAAYDRYADPLYKYCRSMLGDPADAADAVQDTFVIAASRLGGLRDPERLRAWLYAIARNECVRVLRARKALATLDQVDQAPDVTYETTAVDDTVERSDLRALLEAAAEGLNPGEREVIELQLRQGLEPDELATALGVSRNHAHALLSRARDQLEACLGVLLVARAGREQCGELAALLQGWDGHLTAALRGRLQRHIQRCATCSSRRAFELRPALLLGLSPGAAIVAAAAESFRLAPSAPGGLKAHTLELAAGRTPTALTHRAAVLGRAGAFGDDGYPKPVPAPKDSLPLHADGKRGVRSSPQAQTAVAASVVLAIAIAAIAFALTGNSGDAKLADSNPRRPASAAPGRPASATASASGTSSATLSKAPASAAPSTAPASPWPSPTQQTSQSASGTPSTITTSPATTPATPTPAPSPTTASPTPSRSSAPSPSPGTLVVNPPGGPIPPGPTWITLTAEGGSVDWSSTVSPGNGNVSVYPSAGTLTAGQSVTVQIWADHWAAGRQVTVTPGGTVFTIAFGHGGPFTGRN